MDLALLLAKSLGDSLIHSVGRIFHQTLGKGRSC